MFEIVENVNSIRQLGERTRNRERRAHNEEYRASEKNREKDRRRPLRPSMRDLWARDYSNQVWSDLDMVRSFASQRNDYYIPYLRALQRKDERNFTQRRLVYATSPLSVEDRSRLPCVWQSRHIATIKVSGMPYVKLFKVEDRTINTVPLGEGEVMREMLTQIVGKKKGFIFPESSYKSVTSSPIYFMPRNKTDMLHFDIEYIDISRCYSQLLQRLPSLAVRFNYANRIFDKHGHLPSYPDGILETKHSGRAIVGMMTNREGRVFRYGVPHRFPSRYHHADTVNWVHAILHSLASYAVDSCQCFRWHTDGGFFPEGMGAKFGRLLDGLGIVFTTARYSAVHFANVDQYEVYPNDNDEPIRTKHFLGTDPGQFIFADQKYGGSQRDTIIRGLAVEWLLSTL